MQERDQLLAQSEEATRARLKQQDLRQKEQQAAALLSQCSTRLARLLNVNATGEHLPGSILDAARLFAYVCSYTMLAMP